MPSDLNFKASDFPNDWKDDVRMNFLFSPFRERYINPEGWDGKMNFWTTTIQELCFKSQSPLISLASLSSALERKGRQPQCLDLVLNNMIRQGSIISISEFNKLDLDKGWLGWGFDVLVQKPVVWGFSSVQSLLNWSNKDDRFVVLSVVKDTAEKLLRRYNDLVVETKWTETAVFLDNFREECEDICSGQSFELAVVQLQKERNAVVYEQFGKKVIKFKKLEDKKVQPLSEVDKGILSLKSARDSLSNDADELEEKILGYTNSAKEHVKNGYRNKAMIALKKKKRLEIVLQKKILALDNIETLLCRLRNAGSEKIVLDAYKTGMQAMKGTVKGDLDLDNIDQVMADVQEVLDDYSEIQSTMAKSVTADDENLDELENELKDILSEEVKQSVSEKRLSPPRGSDEDLLKRLAALRTPPEGVPPVKKPAKSRGIRVPDTLL